MRHKAKVLLAVLGYGNTICPQLGTWLGLANAWLATHPRIENVLNAPVIVCPTPVARHRIVKAARDHGCDIIISIDGDTQPHDQFHEAAIEFLLAAQHPSVFISPYVCNGPEERVQVFRWRLDRTGDPNEAARLDHVPREEAAYKRGTELVACAGTGCYACHTDVFDRISPPYFDYEYADKERTIVSSTEDVQCFRDLSAAGVPLVVSWDHWCTHWKLKAYGKPAALDPNEVWGRTRKLLQARDLHAPEREPDPPGWFDYPELYDSLIRACRPGGTVVEVGSFTGVSFVHLAGAARVSGKGITCVSVDHGLGGEEPNLAETVRKMGGTSAGHLARRINAAGLTQDVLQIVGTSAMASRQFQDGTVDAVFLDANHDTESVLEDVRLWWPKLIPGGTLCGHDWDRHSVQAALAKANIDAQQSPLSKSCWEAIKPLEVAPVPTVERSLNGTHKRTRAKKGATA